MERDSLTITSIGGPTALIELAGLRLLTDPTFDPTGSEYTTPVYTLRKTEGPAIAAENLGRVDVVLLSHDMHFDNLDRAGRELLQKAGKVLTTLAGAERLGGKALGLAPWQNLDIPAPDGRTLRVTGTPARHGPAGSERGPVTGFVLALTEWTDRAFYFSGDTVWYEGMEEVSRRFPVTVAMLNMGAARVKEVGPAHLTLTAEEGVETARTFPKAKIMPVHYRGWEHFSESRKEIEAAFQKAGIEDRLVWVEPGETVTMNG